MLCRFVIFIMQQFLIHCFLLIDFISNCDCVKKILHWFINFFKIQNYSFRLLFNYDDFKNVPTLISTLQNFLALIITFVLFFPGGRLSEDTVIIYATRIKYRGYLKRIVNDTEPLEEDVQYPFHQVQLAPLRQALVESSCVISCLW